jgi:hypothetical protein
MFVPVDFNNRAILKDQLYLHPHATDAAVGEIAIHEVPG